MSEEDFHTSNTLIWTTEDRMSLHLLRNVTKTEIYSSDMTKKKENSAVKGAVRRFRWRI